MGSPLRLFQILLAICLQLVVCGVDAIVCVGAHCAERMVKILRYGVIMCQASSKELFCFVFFCSQVEVISRMSLSVHPLQ